MSREGGPAQTHDSACLDAVKYECAVLGYLGDKGVREVDSLGPLVALDDYLDMSHPVAGKILARSYALDSPGHRGVDESRDESARLCYHLPGLHHVPDSHGRLGRSAKVLGH